MTDDAIARGKRAKALLEDELIVEAFDAAVAGYYREWLATASDDFAAREKIYLKARQIGEVKRYLVSIADSGLLAEAAEENQ